MANLWSIFSLLVFGLILVVAVAFTLRTSRGDNLFLKLLKSMGMFVSLIPLAGLIIYLSAKGRPSGYGEKCGIMALIGLGWYVVLQAGRKAFLAP